MLKKVTAPVPECPAPVSINFAPSLKATTPQLFYPHSRTPTSTHTRTHTHTDTHPHTNTHTHTHTNTITNKLFHPNRHHILTQRDTHTLTLIHRTIDTRKYFFILSNIALNFLVKTKWRQSCWCSKMRVLTNCCCSYRCAFFEQSVPIIRMLEVQLPLM